jgi:electron transport complex protein RnfB
VPPDPLTTLADRIDAALPQTQCTRCGYADCRAYAQAIADGAAGIDQCPPGGAEGVARLAQITGRPAFALSPAFGVEGPRRVMFVDEAHCIGCTLCIKACPVDCIEVEVATPGRSGWDAWSDADAERSRRRYAAHRQRLEREAREAAPVPPADAKQAAVEAALKRARERAAAARA